MYDYHSVDEDGVVRYFFRTAAKDSYTVTFQKGDYDSFLHDCPELLQNAYGFGFERTSDLPAKRPLDPEIGLTIRTCIQDFMSRASSNVALIYHCDTSDFRQEKRG